MYSRRSRERRRALASRAELVAAGDVRRNPARIPRRLSLAQLRLAPLDLAAHGASVREIAVVAALYPVVWGAGQLLTGRLSDHTGRKPLITAGLFVQAVALGLLVAGDGAVAPSLAAAASSGSERRWFTRP